MPRIRGRAAFVTAAVWMAVAVVRAGAGQEQTIVKAPEMTQSTMLGVYSQAQADKGQTMFGSLCSSCHKTSSHSGPAFAKRWVGHPLSELYETIRDTMPDDNPATLTDGESIQLVSYLLKLNGIPAGKDDLPADSAALKIIKIEVPPEKD